MPTTQAVFDPSKAPHLPLHMLGTVVVTSDQVRSVVEQMVRAKTAGAENVEATSSFAVVFLPDGRLLGEFSRVPKGGEVFEIVSHLLESGPEGMAGTEKEVALYEQVLARMAALVDASTARGTEISPRRMAQSAAVQAGVPVLKAQVSHDNGGNVAWLRVEINMQQTVMPAIESMAGLLRDLSTVGEAQRLPVRVAVNDSRDVYTPEGVARLLVESAEKARLAARRPAAEGSRPDTAV